MPHKHTRKGKLHTISINQPPNQIAEPLQALKSSHSRHNVNPPSSGNLVDLKKKKSLRLKEKKHNIKDDDTPKAFLRLMAFKQGKKLPKALDDGDNTISGRTPRSTKRRKVESGEMNSTSAESTKNAASERLEIKPGEKLSEFGARVDAALPVNGLKRKSYQVQENQHMSSLKAYEQHGQTRTEKRIQKMCSEWRKEEARRQEKRQEAAELAEENNYLFLGTEKWDLDMNGRAKKHQQQQSKKKKKKNSRKIVSNKYESDEEDLWKNMEKKDFEERKRRGLHDVVLAPPKLINLSTKKLRKGTSGGKSNGDD